MIISEGALLFRFHMGSLDNSMKTVTEIKSLEQLMELSNGGWHKNPITIEIKPYMYDHRINWDTHIVVVHAEDMIYPIGYLNCKPDWGVNDNQ